ncbi:hypothetical protein Pyn_40421 [Prunus yedoensis var. nudiflora]|uniref:Uncharacterized protein n=1 Tax=Prunus yedoensis var. nudiflora TaxID=2094558 RepID=A0A314V1W6_PRUYE|nr:hypothetical protein Pyn_40421 [Prunus yedoensis var. nudiflora]
MHAGCRQDVERVSIEAGARLEAEGSYAGAQRARRMCNARRHIVGSSWQVAEMCWSGSTTWQNGF